MNSKTPKPDMVNTPPHYAQGSIECIQAIEAALGRDGFFGFLRGQVIKYIWRCPNKGNILEDTKKAQWYLNRLIQLLEGESDDNVHHST